MRPVRIGNGCGFWGDNLDAPMLLAEHGRLDYLTLEYLAELTMSILAVQKAKDPTAGYATDFLVVPTDAPVLSRLLADSRWRRLYADSGSVLFEHADGGATRPDLSPSRRIPLIPQKKECEAVLQ